MQDGPANLLMDNEAQVDDEFQIVSATQKPQEKITQHQQQQAMYHKGNISY